MGNLPRIDMIKTGRNITRLRKKAGLTVKELQEAFGFATHQAVYKWQRGTSLTTVDNLLVLSVLLGVSLDELIITFN